jgi:DNA-binding NtrC family response regulator
VAFSLKLRKDIHDQMTTSEENSAQGLPRVLAAHEDVGTLRLLRETLETFIPCRVDTPPNAEYAFELALQRQYKLFIFGLGLPVIKGELLYSLLVKVLTCSENERKKCPGVIYIGDPEHSGLVENLQREARVKGVLVKPLSVDRIVSTVKKVTAFKLPNTGGESSG